MPIDLPNPSVMHSFLIAVALMLLFGPMIAEMITIYKEENEDGN